MAVEAANGCGGSHLSLAVTNSVTCSSIMYGESDASNNLKIFITVCYSRPRELCWTIGQVLRQKL